MTSYPTENYGSVGQKSDIEEDKDYDIDNSRYLVSTGEERRRSCIHGFVPVIIFAALMIGITYLLSHDFGKLYPGHGGIPQGDSSDSKSHLSLDDEKTPTSSSTETTSQIFHDPLSMETCEANKKCFETNLSGKCCPTMEGVFLACCRGTS